MKTSWLDQEQLDGPPSHEASLQILRGTSVWRASCECGMESDMSTKQKARAWHIQHVGDFPLHRE